MRWFGLVAVMWAAGCEPAESASPAPAAIVVDQGAKSRALAQVHQLAAAAGAALATQYPAIAEDTPPTFGPCPTQTAAQQATLARLGATADLRTVRGCADLTVVNATSERPNRTRTAPTGVWQVIAVDSTGHDRKIAGYTGTPMTYWSEWAQENTVEALAVSDLDGDGKLDILLAATAHEGGSSITDYALSAWLGGPRRSVLIGHAGDTVTVAREQPRDLRHPIVLAMLPHEDSDHVHLRCVEPKLGLTTCPAAIAARSVVDQMRVAGELATIGALPDRELLDDDLGLLGVSPAARAPLLAAASPTAPELSAERAVARVADTEEPAWRYQELPRPDADPAELAALLGHAACPPASPADRARALAAIARWIPARDKPAEFPTCGQPDHPTSCDWGARTQPAILSSCRAGARVAYVAAQWSYTGPGAADGGPGHPLLLRGGVFALLPTGAVEPIATSSSAGSTESCAACDNGPPSPLPVPDYFVHDGVAVAQVITVDPTSRAATLAVAVDGTLHTVDVGNDPKPYTVGVVNAEPGGYQHWDVERDAWTPLLAATDTIGVRTEPPTTLTPAAAWLWRMLRVAAARDLVTNFNAEQFASGADYRAETLAALALIHAPADITARVTAAAARFPAG